MKFIGSQANFYFWLNVSAILYNNELKKRDDKSQGSQISFDEFQELDENDLREMKITNMNDLLLPEKLRKQQQLQKQEEQAMNQDKDKAKVEIDELLNDQVQGSKTFYEDFRNDDDGAAANATVNLPSLVDN